MAGVTVSVIDRRIEGRTYQAYSLKVPRATSFTVDAATGIVKLMTDIKTWLGARKISTLTMVGHGISGKDGRTGAQVYVYEICKEYLTEFSAPAFGILKGRFASKTVPGIELISCGPSGSQKSVLLDKALISQGVKICQAIANAAGTAVRASPDTQIYGSSMQSMATAANPLARRLVVNPGPWEGKVWTFLPGKSGPYRTTASGTYQRVRKW
ncbi:MAG: hypothetical protein KDA64_03220 [Rhodospirillaceae bacterium]|nr:hypothetical protein [Rhodospirillaceae bacterium]